MVQFCARVCSPPGCNTTTNSKLCSKYSCAILGCCSGVEVGGLAELDSNKRPCVSAERASYEFVFIIGLV